ncbi:MAG TPA: SDR family oxidoreductase [Patescibacteria group bacterium]|nr:SDR family oxidoreductase [Patescibacteria group bacterium]
MNNENIQANPGSGGRSLSGRNALITGGSQGMGKAIARQFLTEGANVVICARDAQLLARTCDELKSGITQAGQQILSKPCDVSSEQQVKDLIEFAMDRLGSLQVLVNNAGVYGPMGPTESVSLSEWRRALEINLFGVLIPCRTVIPRFKEAGRGKIIILSGGGATNPLPNISAYAASKAAVARLMETLAEELRPFHIDVNGIAPGALATRLVDEVLAAGPEKVGQAFYEKNKKWKNEGATPLHLGAGLAVYLASAESDGITGKLISAQWDPWQRLHQHREELANSDIYSLRRIVPEDRGKKFS